MEAKFRAGHPSRYKMCVEGRASREGNGDTTVLQKPDISEPRAVAIINTLLANKAEEKLGDRPTATTNKPDSRPNETILVLRWYGNEDVRVKEVPLPAITEPADVNRKVTGTTVCGSDLHLYHKEIVQLQKGEILGDEWTGIVDEVEAAVESVKKGDKVVTSFQSRKLLPFSILSEFLHFLHAQPVCFLVSRLDSNEMVNAALRACRKFGIIALVADYAVMTNQFMIGALMEKGITLRGTGQASVQKYWHELLKKVESGEFDSTIILTLRFKTDDFSELYDTFDGEKHDVIKTFMQMRFSRPRS
ncbi:hypothetical protein B0A49_04033 [Cryomyces minteri]|uniref:Alcohol dehydrogenase-like N-terminal domain-containing protein n=1 Tax=Cryomyces minteri TaxID=331657 RepID=A0A4U0XGD9_9PEZI|nr:hypothetical protein B0A49_04033 [Cryomyces minteri]